MKFPTNIQRPLRPHNFSHYTSDISVHIKYLPIFTKKFKIDIYKITILSAVLYGYDTWSPTLRKEGRYRVFKKKKRLRRISLSKKD
jgi:hypothetical protein